MSDLYLNNPQLKKAYVPLEWTAEQVKEVIKCSKDIGYFIRTYVKIINLDRGLIDFEMYPFQEEMAETIADNRFTVIKTCRQAGKTTTSAAVILWHVLFNDSYTVAILANKLSTAREILARVQRAYEYLPKWLQQGVIVWNKTNIELENGSQIIAASTASSAIRGYSCVSGDTYITVCDNENIYHTKINNLINKNSKLIEVKETKMMYCVYKITNKVNQKIYVGFHKTDNLQDGYMGSGKLIKRAIEKYGIENFEKEILKIFDSQKEAEEYEAQIVDRDFTLKEDTYNIAIGGNVRIMYGKNNPFYGKTHTQETRQKISDIHKGKSVNHFHKIIMPDNSVVGYEKAAKTLDITSNVKNNIRYICGNPHSDIRFEDDRIQAAAEKYYMRKNENNDENKKRLIGDASKRFLGVPKSDEHKIKISEALTGIKRENPQNKDPEKIRKTAEKHRGMKRSEEARKKMSEKKKGRPAHNKGKAYCYCPNTLEKKLCRPDEIPSGWLRGYASINT